MCVWMFVSKKPCVHFKECMADNADERDVDGGQQFSTAPQ